MGLGGNGEWELAMGKYLPYLQDCMSSNTLRVCTFLDHNASMFGSLAPRYTVRKLDCKLSGSLKCSLLIFHSSSS